ncbi:MAG: CBO0543 family protein [Bacillota bacterium]
MTQKQQDALEQLRHIKKSLSSESFDYWINFSNASTWQFWVNIALLVLPLITLYIFLDKRRALHIGFFGFNIHIWFTYIDQFGVLHGLWQYPYKVVPFMPFSFVLDVSLVPVVYMLVYQWTVNHQKNRYLYLILLSAVFAFIFKPILSWLDLFKLYEGVNFVTLFCGYLILMLVSIWITAFFLHLQRSVSQRTE